MNNRLNASLPEILTIEQLSPLIGKTAATIRTCATNAKYTHLIPRPFKLPASRRLLWRKEDVLAWLSRAEPVEPGPGKVNSDFSTKTKEAVMTTITEYDELYDTLLAGPLGTPGAEELLPAVKALCGDMKRQPDQRPAKGARPIEEDFLQLETNFDWPTVRRDIGELKKRILNKADPLDRSTAFAVVFLLEHALPLTRLAILHNDRFGWRTIDELLVSSDLQTWLVNWLRTALVADLPSIANGGDDDGPGPACQPAPKPADPEPDSGFEY